ncbi:MAG: rRNA maturation RNase YbeY [Burkholderiaceae bacterium]|nr:rRNA maturation RNase YbeY [Burkholderiaceae bacterium]
MPPADRPGQGRPTLRLALQCGKGIAALPASRARIRRLVSAALEPRPAEITIRFVGRAESQALNSAYRGKAGPTNVLTFGYDGADRLCADIVVCVPLVRDEARVQRKPFDHHLAHLLVHGSLHARGLDHLEDQEAAAMEAEEKRILRRFRIADPYVADATTETT